MKKRMLCWGSILSFLSEILFFLAPPEAFAKTELSIVYTNDVMGEVEPCG